MKKILLLSAYLLLISCIAANSQTLPSGFSSTNIASGWSNPMGAAFTTDGQQLFVWERAGKVYVCNRNASGTYVKQSTPVLDISEETGYWGDHGLLGFALDPNFASNGFLYLLYVVDRHHLLNFGTGSYSSSANAYNDATIGRVTRYKTIINGSNLVTDAATRTILIGETRSTGIPLLHQSHGLGTLAFASDGTLLVSAGDGASFDGADPGSIAHTYYAQAITDGIIRPEENIGAFRAQLLNCHNGKLLRIDPATGDGVSSNPFYSELEPRSPKSRVWALGFRNPFRFSIRPGTGSANPLAGDIGEIYVGDVGWFTYEELNIIKSPGMNCGWPLYEGHTSMANYFTLNKTNQDEPNPLYGTGCTQQKFTFNNLIKQATADNITTVYNPCNASEPIGTGNRYFHRRPAIDWHHTQNAARVGIFNGNNAAVATIGTPESNVVGTPFLGNCAIGGCWYTGDAFPVAYKNTFFLADFGGQFLKRATVDYTDVITRIDNFGTGFSNLVCIIENPLDGTLVTVEILAAGNGVKKISYGGNQFPTVNMSSDQIYSASSLLNVDFTSDTYIATDPDGSIASYSWDFGDGNTSTSPNPSYTFNELSGEPTKYTVILTITDNQGASANDSVIISINNTPPVVNITSPVNNSTYAVGGDATYPLTADVSDIEHDQGHLKYKWQTILRHNNHEHAEPIDTNKISETQISRVGCNGEDYYWFINLTVTDEAGLSTIDSSKIFPDCQGALPLVLKKFSVTQQGNESLIKWTTESEMNIGYFEVERSTDGVNFFPINQTPGRNTSGPNEYNFTDNNFSTGVNYYRLKIVEADSVIRYSVIVKTFSETKREGIVISPNPVRDNFSISYTAADNGPVIIHIRDISGRLVNTIHESVIRGQNIIYLQSLPAWKPGIYLVSLQQGDDIQHGKLIKAE